MLSVIMLNFVMTSVIMMSVVGPKITMESKWPYLLWI